MADADASGCFRRLVETADIRLPSVFSLCSGFIAAFKALVRSWTVFTDFAGKLGLTGVVLPILVEGCM